MSGNIFCQSKFLGYFVLGTLSAIIFYSSIKFDFQHLIIDEHIRFRSGFPSQTFWIRSPLGTLKCYLFNVTNSEAFLNGTDTKLKLEEVGPIAYRIKGRNEVLNQTKKYFAYKKIRYDEVEFDPVVSVAPDILNRTLVLPNYVLLGVASKFHDWTQILRYVFNALTINEPVFLNQKVQYFLWDFTVPTLNVLAKYVPNFVANCGMLYNALRPKDEVYHVRIGEQHGKNGFFRIDTLNNRTYFPQHVRRLKYINDKVSNIHCPIDVTDAFDNSLFPPLIENKTERYTIVGSECCRTFQLKYNETTKHIGFMGYKYVFDEPKTRNHCLNDAMGIKLYDGMFDVSKCLFNDVPAAFSYPHFFGSSYNWSEHFEGFVPDAEKHETSIIIQPTSGIPIEEKYRFQSNMPMPDMKNFRKDMQLFSKMVLPTFWYEYDLDVLPANIRFLMWLNIIIVPILQPIFITIFAFGTGFCFFKACFLSNKSLNKN